MQYGTPKNSRQKPTQESGRSGPVKKKFGKKKFGLRLYSWSQWWGSYNRTKWYKTKSARNDAYRVLRDQREWWRGCELVYDKVEKIER